ncbi:nucleotidyl transferase AbiEii/AbiGii toxin family protein [Arenibacter sp. GZD96]|uniref:nucleotidyl transferase AbiEii/AbiGii toxin family protein n=1 Tax=Aurantibrevibacter litoralis TaxID=3106030 RepID=UPI002AFF22BB|nr:nucleotidyl transferase AbiEii/AbiGii toxin family protein [Arenibacter sp. GZD-96]MEA1785155.1 nucleotidyl transferase AbiEii/AbiGii toxin family protein [Arenibacter sp. GZD-96]
MPDYLHDHPDFPALLRIVADERKIIPILVEKDYWIMHTLYGLQLGGYEFQLKGGTSLSKGYGIIHRFSEDIDIHIRPPDAMNINVNPNNSKAATIAGRKAYYDWLAQNISMPGITNAVRDTDFDNPRTYLSGGIRLYYKTFTEFAQGVKEGILLEAGFDRVSPNNKLDISSWAYEKAIQSKVTVIDNRALGIACYSPGYTFVEKLQTIATEFRSEREDKTERPNLMRQYYDVCSLLQDKNVQTFIGTPEYWQHKIERFPKKDYEIPMCQNQAFLLTEDGLLDNFKARFVKTAALYYNGQPSFEDIIFTIRKWVNKL